MTFAHMLQSLWTKSWSIDSFSMMHKDHNGDILGATVHLMGKLSIVSPFPAILSDKKLWPLGELSQPYERTCRGNSWRVGGLELKPWRKNFVGILQLLISDPWGGCVHTHKPPPILSHCKHTQKKKKPINYHIPWQVLTPHYWHAFDSFPFLALMPPISSMYFFAITLLIRPPLLFISPVPLVQ